MAAILALVTTYVIGEPCVDVLDRACVDECPVDCSYEGERMLYIHPDEHPARRRKSASSHRHHAGCTLIAPASA